jgi:hypothetical protein
MLIRRLVEKAQKGAGAPLDDLTFTWINGFINF